VLVSNFGFRASNFGCEIGLTDNFKSCNLRNSTCLVGDYAALVINPERRQREQTFIRIVLPSLTAFTLCKLGYQTFWVLLLAWLTLWPKTGPFPQISQTFDISEPQNEFYLK